MATEPIIYLDFDGVLANFYDNFMAITGANYPHLSRGLADAHWQTYVHAGGFASNPLLPGAQAFVSTLMALPGVQVQGLTSCGGERRGTHQAVTAQKESWLAEHFGEVGLQAHIVTNWTDKARYARANALLLDDSHRNCQAFITAGGHAVHHTGDLAHSLQAIRAFLDG